ncbi:hypothetical protein IFM89_015426, partial [Coptis chinensis]
TKPHGHGDVHLLLYSSGLLRVCGNGLKELSQKFKSCSLLKSSKELKDYLQRKYQDAAQYDSPEDTPVEKICSVIDAMSTNSDVLSRIFAGIEAIEGNEPPKCYPISILMTYASIYQWTWQVSQIYTELIEPSTTSTNDTMFQIPSASYSQKEYCEELDLKPENFLLVNRGEDSPLKATDFGVSVFIEEGKVYRDIVGSAYYVAPEVLGRSYGKDIDVWSAGTEKGIFEAILEGKIDIRSAPWPSISDAVKDIVKKMLTWDPKKWINAAQALVIFIPDSQITKIIADKRVGTLCQSDPISPTLKHFCTPWNPACVVAPRVNGNHVME